MKALKLAKNDAQWVRQAGKLEKYIKNWEEYGKLQNIFCQVISHIRTIMEITWKGCTIIRDTWSETSNAHKMEK